METQNDAQPTCTFCLAQSDFGSPGVLNHTSWKEKLWCLCFLMFPSVYFDISHSGGKYCFQVWPRSNCHKSSSLPSFWVTHAKTALDKRDFLYLVYLFLWVKEWKFRREKPLNKTTTAQSAECALRQQERF